MLKFRFGLNAKIIQKIYNTSAKGFTQVILAVFQAMLAFVAVNHLTPVFFRFAGNSFIPAAPYL